MTKSKIVLNKASNKVFRLFTVPLLIRNVLIGKIVNPQKLNWEHEDKKGSKVSFETDARENRKECEIFDRERRT